MAADDDERFAQLDDGRKLAARILDMITYVAPRRIEQARAGRVNSASVSIPWWALVDVLDEVERQYPGVIARFQADTEADRKRRTAPR